MSLRICVLLLGVLHGSAQTTTTTTTLSQACLDGMIQCEISGDFNDFEYYVNGSDTIPECRSAANVRSASDIPTFNMSICQPDVNTVGTHQHSSITLIPVLPWIIYATRIPGPMTCTCMVELKKEFKMAQEDLVVADAEEQRNFEVDGLVMKLGNETGKFIIDIESLVLPIVKVESCKISDGDVNELPLIQNFNLMSAGVAPWMTLLSVNLTTMPSTELWQMQMKSFTLPNKAMITFFCTVHHCAQEPCPANVRRLSVVEASMVPSLPAATRQLSQVESSAVANPRRLSSGMLTSISSDPNGVALDFDQETVTPAPIVKNALRGEANPVVKPPVVPVATPILHSAPTALPDPVSGGSSWSQLVSHMLPIYVGAYFLF